MSHVLLFGSDPWLRETRRLLLQREGHQVQSASHITDIDRKVHVEPPDLLILCHSLSTGECRSAITYLQSRWPLARTLLLTKGSSDGESLASECFDAQEGPGKFLATVSKLLAPPAKGVSP